MRWKTIISIAIGFIGACLVTARTEAQVDITQGISEKIIRFHVIANSDSEEDQTLKLDLKNYIAAYMEELLADTADMEGARARIEGSLAEIQQAAAEYITERGYSYPVSAAVETSYFPIKTYGNGTFPAGEYEALKITIGEGRGKNWWCVLYPNLCFVDATHGVVTEENLEELKDILTEAEFNELTGQPDVKIRFKFLTFLNP